MQIILYASKPFWAILGFQSTIHSTFQLEPFIVKMISGIYHKWAFPFRVIIFIHMKLSQGLRISPSPQMPLPCSAAHFVGYHHLYTHLVGDSMSPARFSCISSVLAGMGWCHYPASTFHVCSDTFAPRRSVVRINQPNFTHMESYLTAQISRTNREVTFSSHFLIPLQSCKERVDAQI